MNKAIKMILENFYICTSLPIMAFDLEEESMGSAGFNERFMDLFDEYQILGKAIELLKEEENNDSNFKTIATRKGSYFTACYIDPYDIDRGIFILGPHSCIKKNQLKIPYKPRCLIGNLVSLLYDIEKDSNQSRHCKFAYSYHIRKALDYINSRHNKNILLIDVANYLDISKSYLCTLLKKETGKTFTQILNEIRVEKSKQLLLEDNSSMLDIALAVGYNNQNYYNIAFRKITGMTPLDYRKVG